jgi:hypothetical protein
MLMNPTSNHMLYWKRWFGFYHLHRGTLKNTHSSVKYSITILQTGEKELQFTYIEILENLLIDLKAYLSFRPKIQSTYLIPVTARWKLDPRKKSLGTELIKPGFKHCQNLKNVESSASKDIWALREFDPSDTILPKYKKNIQILSTLFQYRWRLYE